MKGKTDGSKIYLAFVITGIRTRFALPEELTCLLWQTNNTDNGLANEISVILISKAH